MSDYHINIFFSDENGGYIADIPDLEACSAFGTTAAEALAELKKAKEAWLAAAREDLAYARHAASGAYHAPACFFAQQVAQKAIKAHKGEEPSVGLDAAPDAVEVGERLGGVATGEDVGTEAGEGLDDGCRRGSQVGGARPRLGLGEVDQASFQVLPAQLQGLARA